MKKHLRLLTTFIALFATTFLLVSTSGKLFAQLSEGGNPPSFKFEAKTADNIDHVVVAKPDWKRLMQEDAENDRNGGYYRVGKMIEVDYSMETSGTWTTFPNGTKTWRLKISAENAIATTLLYKNFYIPKGAQLFVYNEDRTQVLGAFTSKNNRASGEFTTSKVKGDVVILEYVSPRVKQPAGVIIEKPAYNLEPSIEIAYLTYIYKDGSPFFKDNFTPDYGGSTYCEVNINCSPEGDNWQDEKRGVAIMAVYDGSYLGYCTGSLVNNTDQDCTPYFLSADHCGGTVSQTYMNYWEFYFNYEMASCTGGTEPSYGTIIGATLRARGDENSGSDFLLMELNADPASYNPYYNGWDRSGSNSANGVGIHHPAGDVKKISTYTGGLSSTTWGSCPSCHFALQWSSTTNGHGVTEGGSSGSPLFNSSGRIIGTLTGGGSYCSVTNGYDAYGKMVKHWNASQNGTAAANKLEPWLDPAGTGATTLDGTNVPCSPPVLAAEFSGSPTTVVIGNTVTYTDQSTGSPTTWNWTFAGGTPPTSTSANPTVTYNTLGTYDVTLQVGDGSTTDSQTKPNYINVIDQGTIVCQDTVSNFIGTPTLYGAQGGGYLSGNNGYGDLSKGEYFAAMAQYTSIDKAFFYFGAATGSSSTITFNVWDDSGGSPNAIIGTATMPIADIVTNVTNQELTVVDFTPDVAVSGAFYVQVVLPTTAGDTLAVVTNADGDATTNTAWETWDDGAWHDYASSWTMSLNHAISVLMCGDAGAPTPPVAAFVGTPTSGNVPLTVDFTDQSTYSPTSWSWTFGDGGTSTQQNPQYVYSAAGTYTVSLVATNADGSDTETKTDYILVVEPGSCGDITTFPHTEDFEGMADDFVCWVTKNNTAGLSGASLIDVSAAVDGDNTWFVCEPASFSGNGATYINNGQRSAGVGYTAPDFNWLISPNFVFDANAYRLRYWAWAFSDASWTSHYYVMVYADGAWNTVGTFTDGTANEYATEEVFDLSAFSNKTIQIAFVYEYTDGYQMAIDDIVVEQVTGAGEIANPMSKIKVYPNPSTGHVFISLGDADRSNSNISVYNNVGSLINDISMSEISNSSVSLDLSSLASGVYMIQVETEFGISTERISIIK